MNWLALDIGGANIKAADGHSYAASEFFPLWQKPAELPQALVGQIEKAPAADRLAVTMTGELADCFQTKAEGVNAILDAVEAVAGERRVEVYLSNGEFTDVMRARAEPLLSAASNWHALASFAARYCTGESGLLIDIGSTTTDVIPLDNFGPKAVGSNDPERLATGELVYTGVGRSPVCALVSTLPWRGESCGVAQELFATTADAYQLLGECEEKPSDTATADGRPFTKEYSRARLARMVCADVEMFSEADAQQAARKIQEAQIQLLMQAVEKVIRQLEETPATLILSGIGEFLARRVVERLGLDTPLVSLNGELGAELSRCAPAHALAVLARERLD